VDILSLKTASGVTDTTVSQMQLDNQGLSEGYLLQRVRNLQPGRVVVAFLNKGQRRKDADGVKRTSSGVIRPWTNGSTWAWEYNAKYKAAGWERRLATEYPGGVAAWVKSLPQEAVEPLCIIPEPLQRMQWHRDEWVFSVRTAMQETQTKNAMLQQVTGLEQWTLAKELFPMTRKNCVRYGSKCCFIPLCHGSPTTGEDPMSTQLYQLRSPHHPETQGDDD
jgi:hypothetical protein